LTESSFSAKFPPGKRQGAGAGYFVLHVDQPLLYAHTAEQKANGRLPALKESFLLSSIMKIFLVRLCFVFHRPCFFGNAFTSNRRPRLLRRPDGVGRSPGSGKPAEPWVGGWDCIRIISFLLWVVVRANTLLRMKKGQGSIDSSKA